MGAPKGNKNGLKWTFAKSEELLLNAIAMSNEKETYNTTDKQGNITNTIQGYKYDFIGEIARELDTYHELITRDIPNQHPELKSLVKKLKYNLESNCYSNTKKGIIREATGIVNLKSNHKWTDRLDKTTDGHSVNEVNLTDKQVSYIIESIKPK